MTSEQVIAYASENIGGIVALFIVVILSAIQASKLEMNPWSWIFKEIGKLVNQDIMEKLNRLEEETKKSTEIVSEEIAVLREEETIIVKKDVKRLRWNIIEFADELRMDIKHSEEHFNHILDDISDYDYYCHQFEIENEKINASVDLIQTTYQECLKENKFI